MTDINDPIGLEYVAADDVVYRITDDVGTHTGRPIFFVESRFGDDPWETCTGFPERIAAHRYIDEKIEQRRLEAEANTPLGRLKSWVEAYEQEDTDDAIATVIGDDCNVDLDRLGELFLLVESNHRRDGEPSFYFTLHMSPDAAARYHTDQEFAEDWTVEVLVNLETDEAFELTVETKYTWELKPRA